VDTETSHKPWFIAVVVIVFVLLLINGIVHPRNDGANVPGITGQCTGAQPPPGC
jgi:hypothetical protein